MTKAIDTVEPLASAIGHMTIIWNHCQSLIFMMFDDALGAGILKAMAIFFALRSDSSQRDVTAALLKEALQYHHPELADKAVRTINDFGKVAGRRNDFIHAIWHFPEDSETAKVWLDVRKNLAGKDPVQEAWSLGADLGEMSTRLGQLYAEVEAAVKPPKNALAGLSALAKSYGLPPPPQSGQTAIADQDTPQDGTIVPPPPRPASEE